MALKVVLPVCNSCGNYSSMSVQGQAEGCSDACGSVGCLASRGLCHVGKGKDVLLQALRTKTAQAGQHRRKGALRETINLHDLMRAGKNNNKKRINP